MSRIPFSACTVLVAALSLVPFSQSMAAPLLPAVVPTASSQTISISGLDLTSKQGWRTAENRIDDASRAVCNISNPMDMATPDDVASCAAEARKGALETLRDIRSEQKNNHRIGHVLLAAKPDVYPHG
ncbi:MAG: UrcA family protein [Gluconobacter sp.]